VGKATCGWIHPGGRLVPFASTHADPRSKALQKAELERRETGPPQRYQWDFDPGYDLYAVEISAEGDPVSAPRALAPAPGYDAEASYSPDGRWIVFASNRHVYDPIYASALSAGDHERLRSDPSVFVDLYLMDAHGGQVRRLTTTPGYDGGPFFSPDGERIVWRHFGEDGKTAEIYSMRVDGSDVRQLTKLGALSWAPFYHPSGDYVVFSTSLQGFDNFELYAVDAAGAHEPVRVTHSEKFDGLPAFTPDGETLVWTSQRAPGGQSQLFRAKWNDALARRLLGLEPGRDATAAPLLPVPSVMREAIDPADLRNHVAALTSDAADGRRTGTPGEKIATGYVARVFRAIGLEPAGEHGTYFHEFSFTSGVSLGPKNQLTVSGPPAATGTLAVDSDWRPLAFSGVGEFGSAPVVFGGYGLVTPAEEGVAARDDYAGLDVSDRWVLVLRDVPSGAPPAARRHWRRFATLRHKAMVARDRGARGVLFVRGPLSKLQHELPPLEFDGSLAGTRIAVIAVSDATASRWLEAGGRDLSQVQAALDRGDAAGVFALEGVEIAARVDLVQQQRRGRSVIGRIPGPARDPSSSEAPPPFVMLGAHVDHLGRGPSAASLSASDDPDQVHRGADDNASGVAALIEIAQDLAARQRRGELRPTRDLLFAAWSGEELGLLGSSRWVDERSNPHASFHDQVAAYLNLDMVGRLRDALVIYGAGSSSTWPALVERENLDVDLPIQLLDESYLPTDATPFYLAGVPVLSAFTGVHEQYHTPQDTADLLDYEGMADIARLFSLLARDVALADAPPDYISIPPPRGGPSRSGLSVYLGTVPDYARTDVRGVRLSGVAPGGPAEEGGLRAGDVVVRVGERPIENLYDYTYALGDLEIGEPVEIGVLRDGRELRVRVTPAPRE